MGVFGSCRVWGLLILTGLLIAPGCVVYDAAERVAAPVELPDRYVGAEAVAATDHENRWWVTLDDPGLDAWVDRVLDENLELAAAWARLDQAEALARQAGALAEPQLSASFSPQRNYAGDIETGRFEQQTQLPLLLNFDQTLDLWGRYRHERTAAAFDAAAVRYEIEETAQVLVGQVVDAWLDLAEQRALSDLLRKQIRTSETLLQLVELRFGQGQATAADVLQQRQQVASLRSQLPPIDARLALAQHRLAILAGVAPGVIIPDAPAGLPDAPALPELGVPSDLLRRRPDIRAAERRVAAADHRVGVAVADRYPSLQLSLSIGFNAANIADFFQTWVTDLAAALGAPILDGGRRAAEVDRAAARTHELLTLYAQTILLAVGDVADAAASERAQRRFIDELEDQLELARQSLDAAQARYRQGLGDFLQVLTAQQTLQQTQQTRLAAQRDLLTFRTQLFLALGGTWSDALDRRPPLPLQDASRNVVD